MRWRCELDVIILSGWWQSPFFKSHLKVHPTTLFRCFFILVFPTRLLPSTLVIILFQKTSNENIIYKCSLSININCQTWILITLSQLGGAHQTGTTTCYTTKITWDKNQRTYQSPIFEMNLTKSVTVIQWRIKATPIEVAMNSLLRSESTTKKIRSFDFLTTTQRKFSS
jgi:hypothetical protein